MKKIYNSNSEIKIIGIRHSEKLHETLLSKEEKLIAEDMKEYYRIPADNRSLNYEKYFEKGNKKISKISDYNSSNTKQLSEIELIKIFKKLNISEHILD